ncbi:thymidylate synthase [Halobacteriales archaeon QH_8_64_26]|nr:MAG: thymidylate synthase [Halobacteriales archaeon QH_8_64_26]
MREYLDLVRTTLENGNHKPNRTNVDTLSCFNLQATYDLQDGFPLLTTRKMDEERWNSIVYEFLWHLSVNSHIKDLQQETAMWNSWADNEGYLDSAVGRFWRRFPFPSTKSDREKWADSSMPWVNKDGSFDQLQYVLSELDQNPSSRRLVVSAWYPANATVSKLPPCDYTFVCNVQRNELNIHLTQRSADLALGVPFDVARYALLASVLAQQTDLELGSFAHTLVDAHIYCGSERRGNFYDDYQQQLQSKMKNADDREEYLEIRDWIEENAPVEIEVGHDHIPGLLTQLAREPYDRPIVDIRNKNIDELSREDFKLLDYFSHPEVRFAIAE